MRSHRHSPEHQEAVSRRLALLSAELTAVRETNGLAGDTPAATTGGVDGLTGGQPVDPWTPATHTRVRAERWETRPELPPASTQVRDPDDAPPDVPVPGRHARRRPGVALMEAVPESWRGRMALGPGQLALVALAVAVGLAITCWWLVRGSPTEVAAPGSPEPSIAAPLVTGLPTGPSSLTEDGAPSAAPNDGPTAAPELVVDVAGKVRRPGIAVLEPGSRVVDALDAAGGPRPGIDLSSLNLARQLIDGEQILVGVAPALGEAASLVSSPTTPPGGTGVLVSLNGADQIELESLPEVGPVTAQAIIAWRDEHGGFTAVDELLEVDGIGEVTLGHLAPLVTL